MQYNIYKLFFSKNNCRRAIDAHIIRIIHFMCAVNNTTIAKDRVKLIK